MAWDVEVTFYREIERTENRVPYLPTKQNQSWEYRVCASIIRSPNRFYQGGKIPFSNKCHQNIRAAEAGRPRLNERPLQKGFG